MPLVREFHLHAALFGRDRDVVVHDLRPDRSVVSQLSAGHFVGESDVLDSVLLPNLESRDSFGVVRNRNRFCQVPSTFFSPDRFPGSRVLSDLRNLRYLMSRPRHVNTKAIQWAYVSIFHLVVARLTA
jgi:hypothetical protein